MSMVMNDGLEELMDAIELGEIFSLVKYLDRLGYRTKDINLELLKKINEDFNKYLSENNIP